ncbi:hypothetical protein ACO0LD_05295 [Undibacterium sp. Ji83W]|uniref:hypothetical protein n=1 Tax=Undibacterium sp. Ji83W TaxID=3413043 RepID=UPI003BF2312E
MTKVTVTGMKASKGTLESGQAYDSTKVYVQTRLDDSKGNAKGFATVEYNFGEASEYDKFKHLTFPFIAEMETEMITSGRAMKTIVTGLTPISIDKKGA